VDWAINTDDVVINGPFIGNLQSRITFQLDSLNSSRSGYLNIQGSATLVGPIQYLLLGWDKGVTPTARPVVTFAQFTSRNGTWTLQAPSITPEDARCWRLATASLNLSATIARVQSNIDVIPGANCATGKQDRVWVAVFIVLLILWGAALLILALITCKCCKGTFWENE
jgi:hypothetical protein